jgi:hypothetical protein
LKKEVFVFSDQKLLSLSELFDIIKLVFGCQKFL